MNVDDHDGGDGNDNGAENSALTMADREIPTPETRSTHLMCPSFLPLDIFFDPEMERNKALRAIVEDEKRLELLKAHLHFREGMRVAGLGRGKSRWYKTDGSFFWKACNIMYYDKSSGRYLIEWGGDVNDDEGQEGRRKFVSRFNLLFDGETNEEVQESFRDSK